MIKQLQSQRVAMPAANTVASSGYTSNAFTIEQQKHIESLRGLIESQLKGSSRAVKAAIEEAKQSHGQARKEVLAFKEKVSRELAEKGYVEHAKRVDDINHKQRAEREALTQ